MKRDAILRRVRLLTRHQSPKWTDEGIAEHMRKGLDELGLALNHQRAVERRAAKRTTK